MTAVGGLLTFRFSAVQVLFSVTESVFCFVETLAVRLIVAGKSAGAFQVRDASPPVFAVSLMSVFPISVSP